MQQHIDRVIALADNIHPSVIGENNLIDPQTIVGSGICKHAEYFCPIVEEDSPTMAIERSNLFGIVLGELLYEYVGQLRTPA